MNNKRIYFIFGLVFLCFSGIALAQETTDQLPKVCVSGIMYDAENSLAVVNGESVKQGEVINGIKITNISESAVSLEYKGQSFERRIGESCPAAPIFSKQTSSITKIISSNKSVKIPSRTSYTKKKNLRIPPEESLLLLTLFVIAFLFYFYTSLCLHKIANKTKTPFAWFAWLPILNVLLTLMIARKPFWWFILLLIPLANIVFMIIIWMEIARLRDKPEWLGVLMMLPVVNLVITGYLAFSS
ncbi:MAG: DUF5684 domain-containing protein [Candidatus Omnitrophica bacterium]|nr:DUF5684 domain-containing protein [Candidatus Omnitrophota bacterium]